MQNKYTIARTISFGISVMFGILLLPPFHQATAGIVLCDSFVGSGSISTFCNDPFGDVDTSPRPLYTNSELQQIQSNQTTENRLKSQYGYTAYSQCMSTSFDKGNPYQVAIHLNSAESCMASYKSTQEAKTQCSAGYVYFNGSCVSGAQGCLNSWGANSIWTGTGCACASGYQWDGSKDKCVATIPTCTANATYNGSQCVCNAGYSSIPGSGVCISNQRALEALKPRTEQSAQVPSCTANATYNGSQCVCNASYFSDNGVCITGTQSCINNYGSRSVYNSADNSCGCVSGFDWNFGQTACVKTATVIAPTANQIIKNNPVAPSASNGISKMAVRVNNSTSTEATTTRPTTSQKGFFSRLLHALNPFSWF